MRRIVRRAILATVFAGLIVGLAPNTKAAVTNSGLQLLVDPTNVSSISKTGNVVTAVRDSSGLFSPILSSDAVSTSSAAVTYGSEYGGVLKFPDSPGAFVSFPPSAAGTQTNPTTNITVEAWINMETLTASGWNIFASHWFTAAGADATHDFHFSIKTSSACTGAQLNIYMSSGSDRCGTTNFTTNRWYQVAFTFQSTGTYGTTKLFVNGADDAPAGNWTTDSRTASTNAVFFLGDPRTNSGLRFIGKIGKFRVYNRALAPTEMRQNFETDGVAYGAITAASVSISLSSSKKNVTSNIVATANAASKITFKANGRVINRCSNLAVNGSNQATCPWKPLTHGLTTLTADMVTTDTSTTTSSATATPLVISVGKRTTAR